jgi:hypothetical protein
MSQSNSINPVTISSNRTDTIGLDPIFDTTVSADHADSSHRKIVEVPISQAAKLLGTSERTVWRRIDRGELKSKTKGNKRLVKIPILTPTAANNSDSHMTPIGRHMTGPDSPDRTSALVDLQALFRDLQAANYRIGYLESQLETHREQVKLLPDLQSKATEAQLLQHRLTQTETELQALKQTWWYRIWKKVKGV